MPCLELVTSDLGQAVDRLRQQIDVRVLGVVPRLVYLRIGQTVVRRQIYDLDAGGNERGRHRERCRMGHGEEGDVGLCGDTLCIVRFEAQIAYAGKGRIEARDALALIARRGDAGQFKFGMAQ